MNFKPTLTKLATLTLLLSSNVYAAPFFSATNNVEQFKAEAQVQNLVAAKPSIENAAIYNVNANALSSTTKQLELNLLPGLTVYANKLNVSTSASGGLIWEGSVSQSAGKTLLNGNNAPVLDSATLINRDGKITGTVRTNGRLFKISPMNNGLHQVIEVNEDNMKPDHPAGAMAVLEQQLTERLSNQVSALGHQHLQQTSTETNLLADPVIRVLVVYSNGVSGEVADIPGLIDLAFAETNTGYNNSDINATVELAHLASINYNSSSISTDLNRLKLSSDGHMDTVHALRDLHNADVVMLIVPDSGSACGQAAAIGAVASTAFAVTAQDCATGYYSFGHELGHLQSARHNPETDGTTAPYAYGHGYRDPSSNWRTVMAYNCNSGCSRINWWSNPNNTRSGVAMGTAAVSDNHRVLNNTAATVAAFRGGATGGGNLSKTSLSNSKGNWLHYSVNVPAGSNSLAATLAGGSGDADLYIRQSSQPSTSSYSCRSWNTSNNEDCTISNPAAGTWYISVHAYAAFSGADLSASW